MQWSDFGLDRDLHLQGAMPLLGIYLSAYERRYVFFNNGLATESQLETIKSNFFLSAFPPSTPENHICHLTDNLIADTARWAMKKNNDGTFSPLVSSGLSNREIIEAIALQNHVPDLLNPLDCTTRSVEWCKSRLAILKCIRYIPLINYAGNSFSNYISSVSVNYYGTNGLIRAGNTESSAIDYALSQMSSYTGSYNYYNAFVENDNKTNVYFASGIPKRYDIRFDIAEKIVFSAYFGDVPYYANISVPSDLNTGTVIFDDFGTGWNIGDIVSFAPSDIIFSNNQSSFSLPLHRATTFNFSHDEDDPEIDKRMYFRINQLVADLDSKFYFSFPDESSSSN